MQSQQEERVPPPPTAPPRKIALCVGQWSHPSTVLTWSWLRQYFLRREADELFIVHAKDKKENWRAGGPLGPDLDTALLAWPHPVQVVSLQGTLQRNIAQFVERNGIDVVVLNEDFPRQSGFQIVSVSDWLRQNITVPFVIIRASAVRNERLRLARGDSQALSPNSTSRRKVAIAYPAYAVGLHLISLAKHLVLLPDDEIYLVHCFPAEKGTGKGQRVSGKGAKGMLRSFTQSLPLGLGGENKVDERQGEITEEGMLEFGAKELAGYNIHLGVVLRGEPRAALTQFCESEGVELLVISTRVGGRLMKTFSGGSVSGYLIDKAPCPCLVAPLKALGMSAEQEEDLSPLSPNSSAEATEWVPAIPGVSSPPGRASPAPEKVAALVSALAERDQTIAALREEVAKLRLEVAAASIK